MEGLKQSMDDLTDDEEMSSLSAKSPPDLQTPGSSAVFASTLSAPRDLRLLHPSPIHISMLCNLYIQNVDPMFKVLYVPALRNMVSDAVACLDNVVSGSHDEALLFAMYYGAITSLTKEECLQNFHDGKDSLLAKYRAGVERALSNANFLTECDLETLQALAIFLVSQLCASFGKLKLITFRSRSEQTTARNSAGRCSDWPFGWRMVWVCIGRARLQVLHHFSKR